MLRHSTPAQYAILLIDLVERQGVNLASLLQGTSLAERGIASVGARLPENDFITLVQNAFRLTGDPALGLHLGLRVNLSAHATLGQAFLACASLSSAIELFIKYHHILAPALELQFEQRDDRCQFTFQLQDRAELRVFSHELLYAGLQNTVSGLLNLPRLDVRYELPYTAPGHAQRYYQVLGNDVHFGCGASRLSFAAALLNKPLPSSNPALLQLYEQECQRLLTDLQEDDSITGQTIALLRKLEGQYPTMPQTAAMFNLSPRTYRRRLEAESSSYQQLLDQVRTEHADFYLSQSRLPLSSIAYMVGFNDVSNFRRAYTKWCGRPPQRQRGLHTDQP